MHIRPKTRRRLLILFVIALVAGGAFTAVYTLRVRRNAAAMVTLRANAMSAYKAGDYQKAVDLLQEYRDKLDGQDIDAEAQFAYAKSLENTPLPSDRHIFNAIRAFESYLQSMKPRDEAAQHELLNLYVKGGCLVEAIHLADDMLSVNPHDGDALRQKALVLYYQHKPDLALAVSRTLEEAEPLNLNGHIFTIVLMDQLHMPADQMIAQFEAQRKAHENDPRFELVLAIAYAKAKQDAEAVKWFKSAAGRTPPDGEFVAEMVARLDSAGLYSDASAYVKRAADAIHDPKVEHLLAQRLWQEFKVAELDKRLEPLDPQSPTADGILIGYRALALYAQKKDADAAPLVAALSHRTDPASNAWAQGLAAEYAKPPLSITERVARLQKAVARNPLNPVLHVFLADALLVNDEAELSVQQCEQAAQMSQGWPTPYVIEVRALIASHRIVDSMERAERAYQRAPDRYDTETALAQSRFAAACESGLVGDYAELLPLLADIQKKWHDASTIPTYVTALARSGKRDEAVATVKQSLAVTPPLAAPVLAGLAQAADEENLGVGEEVREFARKIHGLTPELALLEAHALFEKGKAGDGTKLLVDASKGHENDLPWRIAIADYQEMSGQGDALSAWIALGDQYPGDFQLQQTILHSALRFKDRAFWARTIDRVKALSGEQGLAWRIERGRWLLTGALSERDKAEAVNLLTLVTHAAPGLAEPHYLLALAMEKVDNIPGAITELTAANDARAADPAITRELVRLLNASHRSNDAQAYLDKLSASAHLPVQIRHWLVASYLDQGANQKAIDLLVREEAGGAGVDHDLMLAKLYRRVGRPDDAAKLYKGLLDKPNNDPKIWLDGADFFATRHDNATSEQFLAKLTTLPLQPGELEINRGRFAEKWSGLDEAMGHYKAAVKVAPQSQPAWEALAGFYLRHHRFPDAATAAADGLHAVHESPVLQAIASDAQSLAALGDVSDFQALVESLCRNPSDPGSVEMLSAATSGRSAGQSAAALAQRFQDIANRHSDNLLLQSQVIQSHLLANQPQAALDVARAIASAHPDETEPQRQLVMIYGQLGEWDKAEQAALLWRQHSLDQPMPADLALARIYLQQPKRDPSGAVRLLEKYVSKTAPQANPTALELYVKGLVEVDRSADAAALLRPLLTASPYWRMTWLDLAVKQKDGADASKWIGQVSSLIPSSDTEERFGLADAWYHIWAVFGSSDALDNAAQTLEPTLADEHGVSAKVLRLAAQIADARLDYAGAEQNYRKVLKIEPQSAEAMNNLAYTLWLEDDDAKLAEARQLAQSAIAARPRDARFYDTLARIQVRQGDRKGAIQSFRDALAKDPASLEAMIGLADLLAREPATRGQAKDLLAGIQRRMDGNPHLSAVLRKQYQSARDAVASSL